MKLPQIRPRFDAGSLDAWTIGACAAVLLIARFDSWRLVVFALALAGAVLVTRIRYATQMAVVLTILIALLAIVGHGPARDGRDGRATVVPPVGSGLQR